MPLDPSQPVAEAGMLVSVDPTSPNAWRKEPFHTQIRTWATSFTVEVRIGLALHPHRAGRDRARNTAVNIIAPVKIAPRSAGMATALGRALPMGPPCRSGPKPKPPP